MVKIRMARHGTKKRPFYRIVATDIESPRNGRFLEVLGTYDPRLAQNGLQYKADRVDFWLKQGAQASQTVGQLLKRAAKAVAGATSNPA